MVYSNNEGHLKITGIVFSSSSPGAPQCVKHHSAAGLTGLPKDISPLACNQYSYKKLQTSPSYDENQTSFA